MFACHQIRLLRWIRLLWARGVVLLLAFGWLWPIRSAAAELKPEELYRRTLPSVMTLAVEAKGGRKFVGTAFLALDGGLAVTAWHLVKDARCVTARFADGTEIRVDGVVDWDDNKDVALIRLNVSNRPLIRLASALPEVGSRAYVLGAPRGFEFSISDGLLSQVQVIDGFRQYQVSCPISPGNSGGPVLNAQGELLGVVAWSEKDAQNLNFATPAACLRELNYSLPAVAWSAIPRSKSPRSTTRQPQPTRDVLRRPDQKQSLAALQQHLKDCTGRKITVVVMDPDGERSFSFVVPATADP